MVNMLQRFGAGGAAALTALTIGATSAVQPGEVSAFPTNQSPPMDQARLLAQPVLMAQAEPSQASSGSPQELGRHDARQIAELEMRIRERNQATIEDDQNVADQIRRNGDAFQKFLRDRQKL